MGTGDGGALRAFVFVSSALLFFAIFATVASSGGRQSATPPPLVEEMTSEEACAPAGASWEVLAAAAGAGKSACMPVYGAEGWDPNARVLRAPGAAAGTAFTVGAAAPGALPEEAWLSADDALVPLAAGVTGPPSSVLGASLSAMTLAVVLDLRDVPDLGLANYAEGTGTTLAVVPAASLAVKVVLYRTASGRTAVLVRETSDANGGSAVDYRANDAAWDEVPALEGLCAFAVVRELSVSAMGTYEYGLHVRGAKAPLALTPPASASPQGALASSNGAVEVPATGSRAGNRIGWLGVAARAISADAVGQVLTEAVDEYSGKRAACFAGHIAGSEMVTGLQTKLSAAEEDLTETRERLASEIKRTSSCAARSFVPIDVADILKDASHHDLADIPETVCDVFRTVERTTARPDATRYTLLDAVRAAGLDV